MEEDERAKITLDLKFIFFLRCENSRQRKEIRVFFSNKKKICACLQMSLSGESVSARENKKTYLLILVLVGFCWVCSDGEGDRRWSKPQVKQLIIRFQEFGFVMRAFEELFPERWLNWNIIRRERYLDRQISYLMLIYRVMFAFLAFSFTLIRIWIWIGHEEKRITISFFSRPRIKKKYDDYNVEYLMTESFFSLLLIRLLFESVVDRRTNNS